MAIKDGGHPNSGWRRCGATRQAGEPENMTDKEFATIDKKKKSGIILNLSNEVLCEVAPKSTAKRMWDKLKALYLKK